MLLAEDAHVGADRLLQRVPERDVLLLGPVDGPRLSGRRDGERHRPREHTDRRIATDLIHELHANHLLSGESLVAELARADKVLAIPFKRDRLAIEVDPHRLNLVEQVAWRVLDRDRKDELVVASVPIGQLAPTSVDL